MTGEEPALSEKISQQLNIMRILLSMQEGDVFLFFFFFQIIFSVLCVCELCVHVIENLTLWVTVLYLYVTSVWCRVPMTLINGHINSFFPTSIIFYDEEIKRITKS